MIKSFIPVAEPSLGSRERSLVAKALKSGWVSSRGEYIDRFEENFARFCGVKHASTTANGTVALHLALLALGIRPGDEVIVPSLTFVATANAVLYTGATPVFADVTPDFWGIDPASVKAQISQKTKAIIVVHLYGHPANMEEIREIADQHGIYVIEDAAEAHGAEYQGRRVGGLADVGIFSFFGNKIITTGEGGMVVTNNDDIADRVNFLKNHGMDTTKRYWHSELGYNYRMTNIQAAMGVAQLERIESFIAKKRSIYRWYNQFLSRAADKLYFQKEMPWAKSVWWMTSVVIHGPSANVERRRDELMHQLRGRHIETRPLFFPSNVFPYLADYGRSFEAPVSNNLSSAGMNLPSGVTLTKSDVRYVADSILEHL